MGNNEVEHGADLGRLRPRREGQPRGPDFDPVASQQDHSRALVGGGVAFVQDAKSPVLDRLERRHDEQAAGFRQARPQVLVGEDVLDLGRAVEAQIREARNGPPRTTRTECLGPLRKSGSANVTCFAPIATSWATSLTTTSSGTTRKRPSYTGRATDSACKPASSRGSPRRRRRAVPRRRERAGRSGPAAAGRRRAGVVKTLRPRCTTTSPVVPDVQAPPGASTLWAADSYSPTITRSATPASSSHGPCRVQAVQADRQTGR